MGKPAVTVVRAPDAPGSLGGGTQRMCRGRCDGADALLDQAPRGLYRIQIRGVGGQELQRRAALFEQWRGSGAQVWMTGTELAPFSAIAGEAAVWRVSAGAVERD